MSLKSAKLSLIQRQSYRRHVQVVSGPAAAPSLLPNALEDSTLAFFMPYMYCYLEQSCLITEVSSFQTVSKLLSTSPLLVGRPRLVKSFTRNILQFVVYHLCIN